MTGDRQALFLGLTAVLLWSTVATAFKLALRYLDVLQLLAWACTCSALALWSLVLWRGQTGQARDCLRAMPANVLLLGLMNPLAYYLLLLQAYALLPAQQAQPINYTWAITLALLAIPLLGQRLTARDVLAVALGYGGVLVIATEGRLLQMQFDSLAGVLYALASTVVWALYWIFNTRNLQDPVVGLCLHFSLATPVAWLLCVWFSSPGVASWQGVVAALYVGLFEMGVTFALWSTALRLASGVARIGNLIFLSPLFSLVFIATILGEPIHPATLIGLAMIIPGVVIQQTGRQVVPAGA